MTPCAPASRTMQPHMALTPGTDVAARSHSLSDTDMNEMPDKQHEYRAALSGNDPEELAGPARDQRGRVPGARHERRACAARPCRRPSSSRRSKTARSICRAAPSWSASTAAIPARSTRVLPIRTRTCAWCLMSRRSAWRPAPARARPMSLPMRSTWTTGHGWPRRVMCCGPCSISIASAAGGRWWRRSSNSI